LAQSSELRAQSSGRRAQGAELIAQGTGHGAKDIECGRPPGGQGCGQGGGGQGAQGGPPSSRNDCSFNNHVDINPFRNHFFIKFVI